MYFVSFFRLMFLSVISLSVFSEEGYKLGAGDLIDISVYEEPDLSMEVRVDSTGIMSYPLLGSLKVLGLTLNEVERALVSGLKGKYLVNPSVTVRMVEYRPFFVKGEVNQAGRFEFQPGLTVGKAVSIAGGLTERASERAIYVVHDASSGSQGEGKNDLRKKVNLQDEIRPGDVVTVEQSFF